MTKTPDPDRLREPSEAFVALLNSGSELPAADPAVMRRMAEYWDAIDLQEEASKVMGLGAIASCFGVDVENFDSFQYMNAGLRSQLVRSLKYGALKEQFTDTTSRVRLFEAAATFPFNGDDVKEAFAWMHLAQHPEDNTAELREQLRGRGGVPDHPSFEARFMVWVREREAER
jgi:hypothetical protein